MKKERVYNSFMQGLLVAAVAAAALPAPNVAFAQLSSSVGIIQTGLTNIPNIVASLFYIGGAALIGSGLLKAKAHAQDPSSNPLGHSLGRIGAGAGLIALPAFGTWLNSTLAIGNSSAQYQGLGPVN
jgi:hypothetical protein